MGKSDAERLADLEERKRQIEARIAMIAARGKERSRKEETRRKVLAGSAVLAVAERDPAAKQKLITLLDGFLTRLVDRAVFDLPQKLEPQAAGV